MTSIGDIFDLPDGTKGTYHDEEIKEKKPRKKVEMSDEKKTAMLERLKAGREKRAQNLKAKAEPKQPEVSKKEKEEKEVKQPKVAKDNKVSEEDNQRLKLSFIKMMAGKEKPVEKYERPKKKIISTNSQSEYKEEATKNKVNEAPTPVATPVIAPVVSITPTREPVVIRTFKKPVWG